MSASNVCALGIDPGISGACAWYFPTHPELIRADDMPVAAGEVDADTLSSWVWQMVPDFAVVEAVGARPGQGVVSMFKFGRSFGVVLGVLSACKVPVHLVTPGKWKRHYGLPADKERARALALRLWPGANQFARKKDHGRAEAALLARYGAETVLLNEAVATLKREAAA